jgi:transcriptional regulator with XRE-family HTH domain
MPTSRLNLVDRELRRTLLAIGDELRRARLNAGLSQAVVAAALDCSATTISRVEQGLVRQLAVRRVLAHGAAVGLVLRVGLYPAGRAVRDAAQLRLLDTFRARLASVWRWQMEVPMPIPGDLRAWDALLSKVGCRIGVEAISRLGDVQAQCRAALLKAHDSGVDRVILPIRDTDANRRALHAASDVIVGSFPLGTKQVMRALSAGIDPGADGIVIL